MIWRQWRRLPVPVGGHPFPERVEAFVSACAMHAAQHERTLLDIAKAFEKKSPDGPGGRS